jgi:hypothetical protein
MLIPLGLVNDRALRSHSIHPNFERIAEAGTIAARIGPVASRATNGVIKSKAATKPIKLPAAELLPAGWRNGDTDDVLGTIAMSERALTTAVHRLLIVFTNGLKAR